jgi:hypothetical protein
MGEPLVFYVHKTLMLLQLAFRTFIASDIDKNTDVAAIFFFVKKGDLLVLAIKDSTCFYIIYLFPDHVI